MRIIIITILVLGILQTPECQNISFQLKHKNAIKSFSPKKKDFLMIAVDESPSLTESAFLYVYGLPTSIGVDSLTIKPNSVYRMTTKENGLCIRYSEYDYNNKLPQMTLDKKSIQYIQYRSNYQQKVKNIARVMFLSSIVSGLVIAPLSSYDFVEKKMNMDVYQKWLIGSGIASGVSLLTLSLTKKKKYYLKPSLDKNHKLWSFE